MRAVSAGTQSPCTALLALVHAGITALGQWCVAFGCHYSEKGLCFREEPHRPHDEHERGWSCIVRVCSACQGQLVTYPERLWQLPGSGACNSAIRKNHPLLQQCL